MKQKRKHRKPKPFPNLTERQQKELLDFLMSAHCLPSPSPAMIQARMRELEAMGLEDIPEYEGISSSVRQYAINSLAIDMARAAGDEKVTEDDDLPAMITFDEQLLRHAEELTARYGLRPMHPERPNNRPRVAGPGSFACWAARSAASDEPGGYSGVGTDAGASVPTTARADGLNSDSLNRIICHFPSQIFHLSLKEDSRQ